MKTTKDNTRTFFLALCVITVLSALTCGFDLEANPELKLIYPVLAVLAASGLLIWSVARMMKNPVRSTTGILVLLVAGFLALTATGWRINQGIYRNSKHGGFLEFRGR